MQVGYLGVTIDNELSFQQHIENIPRKLSRSVDILCKLRFLLPRSSLFSTVILTHTAPSPIFSSVFVWGSAPASHLVKLQRIRNKAVRVISSSNVRSPITPQFHKLSLLKIADLYSLEIAKVMHQCSKQLLPVPISSFFKHIPSVHNRLTRASSHKDLYLPKFATSRSQKSIKYQGAKTLNFLSNKLPNKPFSKFKTAMKNNLLDNYL